MPPKPKVTKEQVVTAAYELMAEAGMQAVVAREVGKKLGTTSMPIFTYFSSMEELKEEVVNRALKEYEEYLNEAKDYTPIMKAIAVRWICFAGNRPFVYETLFLNRAARSQDAGDIFYMTSFDIFMVAAKEINMFFGIPVEEAKEIVLDICFFLHGIAKLQPLGLISEANEKMIFQKISKHFVSAVTTCMIYHDCMDINRVKEVLSFSDQMPVKRDKPFNPDAPEYFANPYVK